MAKRYHELNGQLALPAKSLPAKSSKKKHSGFVLLSCAFIMVVLFGLVAIVFDFGRALHEQHRIGIAADAASLAALNVLGPGTTYTQVLNEVNSIAVLNNVAPSELLLVQCGQWLNGVFTPQAVGTCNSSADAVRVISRRVVPTFFARLIGVSQLAPRAQALSYAAGLSTGSCIRPFGVENSFFSSLYQPGGIQVGQTFTVGGHQSPGNWGKIDINGNLPDDWPGAMLNDLCDTSIQLNAVFTGDTGYSQIRQVFQDILDDITPPPAATGMVIALTTDFPNGGSGPVTLLEFIKVDFLSHSGNGQNWSGTFRLVERNVTPPPPPGVGASVRYLVQ